MNPTVEQTDVASRWSGVYSLCHDGWTASLRLTASGQGQLEGAFLDLALWGRRHEVTARVADDDPDRLDLAVLRFNELPRQDFTGFRMGAAGFAGVVHWRSQEFGFFAIRGPVPLMARFHDPTGQVSRRDFLGTYTVRHSKGFGTLELVGGIGGMAGRYTDHDSGEATAVPVRVGTMADHSLHARLPMGHFAGYLFTRPKNCVAGVLTSEAGRSGCYMVKCRGGQERNAG